MIKRAKQVTETTSGEHYKFGLLIILGMWIVYLSEAWALVEYSETPSQGSRMNSSAPQKLTSVSSSGSYSSGASSDRLSDKMFNFSSGFGTTNVSLNERGGRIDTWSFEGRIETPWQVWANFSHWMADTKDEDLTEGFEGKSEQGNPEIRLGFNWLNIGPVNYVARVDFYGGVMVAAKNSLLGSSRTDKIAGASTSKRFESLVGGLGAEIVLTGTPEDRAELKIGNITKLSAMAGWVVSSDIRLAMEASSYKIRTGDEDKADQNRLFLRDSLSFGVLSPRLMLGLGPMVELTLGGHIRTSDPNKGSEQNLMAAKLNNIPGAYGNTVTAGLGFSL